MHFKWVNKWSAIHLILLVSAVRALTIYLHEEIHKNGVSAVLYQAAYELQQCLAT